MACYYNEPDRPFGHTELPMSPAIPGTIAVLLYVAGAIVQFLSLSRRIEHVKTIVSAMSVLAVLCHGWAVYADLYSPAGLNLGLFSMLSVMAVSIVFLVLLSSLRRPVANLFIAILPIAALSLVLELLLEGSYTPRENLGSGIVGHILLSVIAYSLLTIGALQAALLSFGDYELRHRNIGMLKNLPPLQTMESLLFETLWVGLSFLTLSILSGFLFVEDFSGPGIIHHTTITMAAWVVFAVLLWGRHQLGWRGAIASRWTLGGFVLLVMGYFGSKLVLEIILGRA